MLLLTTVTPLHGLEDVCQHVAVELVHVVRLRETDALRKVNVLSPPTELTRGVFRREDAILPYSYEIWAACSSVSVQYIIKKQ